MGIATNIKIVDGFDLGLYRGHFTTKIVDNKVTVDPVNFFSTRLNQLSLGDRINERVGRILSKEHWTIFKFDPRSKEALLNLEK